MPQQQNLGLFSLPEVRPSITDEVTSHLAKLPSCGVVSQDWDAVRGYLEQNSDLAPLLPGICAAVRKEFGPEAEVALELYRDPEIKDETLTLYLRLDAYEADILERLDRASEPFMDKLAQASGYLLPTTDFRSQIGERV